jgi:dipeptidase D
MLNLDSEAEGVFWVSCAGGERVTITFKMQSRFYPMQAYHVRLSGFAGGHSGTEIDKGRLNAVRCLAQLLQAGGGEVASIWGGTVDNAIPSSAEALFVGDAQKLHDAFAALSDTWREAEPDVMVDIRPMPAGGACLSAENSERLLSLLLELPWGVQSMSRDIEGLVETSLNLGVCKTELDSVQLHYSVRSGVDAERQRLIEEMERIALSYGASVRRDSPYPAWQYRPQSPLRETAAKAYAELYGKTPSIQAVHAGLECGLFAGKIPDLDCISLGPDIYDIHSPKERLSVASVQRTYELVRKILS